MATIITRTGKGSGLSFTELDSNFTNLNTELGTKLDSTALNAEITARTDADTAETNARILADNTEVINRNAAIATETNIRATVINNETTDRIAGDAATLLTANNLINSEISARTTADTTETNARIAADNAMSTALSSKIGTSDVVNNLTSTSINAPLSANQGKIVKDALDLETTNRTNADTAEIAARNIAINTTATVLKGTATTSNDTLGELESSINNLNTTLKGTATIAGDTLGELEALINTVSTTLKGTATVGGNTLGKLEALIASLSAANLGDETASTIKTKLDITTLSGSNTGDQTLTSLGIANVQNKSSATILNEITNTLLITKLGFTPYDATNPAGYIDANTTQSMSNKKISALYVLDKTSTQPVVNGAISLDISTASIFNLTLAGNITGITILNAPTLNNETLTFVIKITQGATAYSVTWFPGINWITTNGSPASAPIANKTIEYIFTTSASGVYEGRKGAST